jgi:hypothetical protein
MDNVIWLLLSPGGKVASSPSNPRGQAFCMPAGGAVRSSAHQALAVRPLGQLQGSPHVGHGVLLLGT